MVKTTRARFSRAVSPNINPSQISNEIRGAHSYKDVNLKNLAVQTHYEHHEKLYRSSLHLYRGCLPQQEAGSDDQLLQTAVCRAPAGVLRR